MMRKVFAFAAMLLVLAACSGNKNNPDTPKASIAGFWELSNVATKATVGSVDVSVYLEFTVDGNFSIYQKIGDGRYSRFTGSYTYSSDVLTGNYSSGSSWGPYDVVLDDTTLKLSSANEEDTYKKTDAIPSTVLSNLY